LHDGAGGDGGHLYSRRIFLTAPEGAPHDLGGHRVAHAILHTNLDRLPAAVRDGVRSEKVCCRPAPRQPTHTVLLLPAPLAPAGVGPTREAMAAFACATGN
jgi:hypothetical protein